MVILGIIGGGQLGMMIAKAARALQIKTHLFCTEENSPASKFAAKTIVADYEDKEALQDFANGVDFITYEFENIPSETIRFLRLFRPVHPDEKVLEISQDRIIEKSYLNSLNIPTTRWAPVKTAEDAQLTIRDWATREAIIKTTRFGYDGKGQFIVSLDDIGTFDGIPFEQEKLICEEMVDYACEISMIIARDEYLNSYTYGPIRNIHDKGILRHSYYPAGQSDDVNKKAYQMIETLANALDVRGVLTMEMFVTRDGRVLANEIAPRVHNSGHLTIEAAQISQFENHVRCVCDMDVMDPEPIREAHMINLLGREVRDTAPYMGQANTFVHNYGKHDPRDGRKMGHVTILEESKKKKVEEEKKRNIL